VKKVLPTLIFLLVTAVAVTFIYKDKVFPPQSGQTAEEGSGGPGRSGGRRGRRRGMDPNRPVAVLAQEAKAADVPVYLHGVGTIRASNMATVRPQVSGRLSAVNVREGQNVKKDEVLAQIDPITYQAAYDQAEAKKAMTEALLLNARQDLKRYEDLAKSDYGTQKQLDTQRALVRQYEAQIRQDEAAIHTANANLDYTTIRAPIDGRTGLRVVDVGNLVSSTDEGGIATIAQIQPIDAVFTLPEIHVGDLIEAKAKGAVALTATVGGETVAQGTLDVIDNRIEEATGTVRLKGSFPNDPVKLWPGQFVNIRLHLKTLGNATVVPAVAVQQGASGRYVFLAQPDETAKLVNVKVAQEDERQAVIAEGVRPGDKVITSGFINIQDGSKITLDSATPETAPAEAQPVPQAERRGGRRRREEAGGERPTGGAAERLPREAPEAASPNAGQAETAPNTGSNAGPNR
jgi:multidrug efflux system membrane fusion protein